MLHLLPGSTNPHQQRLHGLRLPVHEPLYQRHLALRRHKHKHRRLPEHLLQRGSPLNIHPQNDVAALRETLPNLLLRDPLVVTVDQCILQQLLPLHHPEKLFLGYEDVVFPVDLGGAAGAGGDGDDEVEGEAGVVAEARDEGVLADAAGTADDDDERVRVWGERLRAERGTHGSF